jgi:hypothetical protein
VKNHRIFHQKNNLNQREANRIANVIWILVTEKSLIVLKVLIGNICLQVKEEVKVKQKKVPHLPQQQLLQDRKVFKMIMKMKK